MDFYFFGNDATFVSIMNSGFSGDEFVKQAFYSTSGFTWVPAGPKEKIVKELISTDFM